MSGLGASPLGGTEFAGSIGVTGPSGPTGPTGPPVPPPWIPAVEATVYSRPGMLLTALPDGDKLHWQEQLDDVGSHETTIPAYTEIPSAGPYPNPERALIPYRSLIQYTLDGVPTFLGVIEEMQTRAVSQTEEVAEEVVMRGRGALAILEEGVVYPWGGADEFSVPLHDLQWQPFTDRRVFDFSSPELDEAAWPAAIEIKQQDDPFDPYGGAPTNWPDHAAKWIWGVGGPAPYPVGFCYFKTRMFLPAETNCRFFVTADDGFDLRVDGASVASAQQASNQATYLWGQTTQVDLWLSAGTHTIAIRGENINRPSSPSTNAAAVICAVYQIGANGQLLPPPVAPSGPVLPIIATDATWKCQAYPAAPPALPIGTVFHTLFDEAKTRGCFGVAEYGAPYLDLGFGQTDDTNGSPWPTVELSFGIGDTLLSVIKQLTDVYCDFRMSRGLPLILNAYNTLGSTPGVALAPQVNLADLSFDGKT